MDEPQRRKRRDRQGHARAPSRPRGGDADDVKERKLLDFVNGKTRVLVGKKPSRRIRHGLPALRIGPGFVGLNDSFEQFYQAVRRFWRFGQTREVPRSTSSPRNFEGSVVQNRRRKEAEATTGWQQP